jgi:uncharacterized protein YdeI (YjbR/CyaY-like superfamily)
MIYIASNIQFDTDGEDIDLPTTMEFVIPEDILNDEHFEENDIVEYVGDEISNITGFCHFGFDIDKK